MACIETAREPVYLDSTWVVRALEREHLKRGIKMGEWLQVPYARLFRYCPQNVLEHMASAYPPECSIAGFTVPIYVGIAHEEGLISVRRNKGKANSYRLVIEHPIVLDMFRQTRAMILPATETVH